MNMKLDERPAASTKLIGGRLCLDFVNTIGGRTSSKIRSDKITDYLDLIAWAMHADLLTQTKAVQMAHEALPQEAKASAVWKRALALREAIYGITKSIVFGAAPKASDLGVLNKELQISFDQKRLCSGRKYFSWKHTHRKAALDSVLWSIADSAAEMLTTADLTRLRQCGGEDCGWLFEDTSRNRSRQWCDMRDCGNVAKVRRFRSRRKRKQNKH